MALLASVIVPVYNDARGAEAALQALLDQDLAPSAYEVIVVDNGSNDDTSDTLQRLRQAHPECIRVAAENSIRGSYAARNRGIEMARGQVLAFTDADCRPAPTWLSSGLAALDAQAASCGGGAIAFTYKAERPNAYEYFDSARHLGQSEYVEQLGFAATANFFARRTLFERRGPFRSDLASGGDYEFGRRVTLAGEKMIYIPEAVVYHPARTTLKAVLAKRRRTALGRRHLEELGLRKRREPSIRQLCPILSYPSRPQWQGSLAVLDQARLVLLNNLVRWQDYFIRARLPMPVLGDEQQARR